MVTEEVIQNKIAVFSKHFLPGQQYNVDNEDGGDSPKCLVSEET